MAGTFFQTRRRVEFRDTDAAGIVHFSVFFSWMENAEHELLRHVGLNVISEVDGRTISWPRVAARCDYRHAIRFDQEFLIDVWVSRLGNKSISWGFRFHRDDQTIADGSLTTVCCEIPPSDFHTSPRPVPVAIPESFRTKLHPYVDFHS